jgi:hypothetical protein
MLPTGFRQIGRCAIAGLALVAASYHLTETWHRQVERARQDEQASQKPRGSPQDKQKGNSRQRPVLCWLAPDMLHRSALRTTAGGSVWLRAGTDATPDVLVKCEFTLRDSPGESEPATVVGRSTQPTCRTYLSDRSAHGPPAMAESRV